MLLGGTEQQIAQAAIGEWLANHRHDRASMTAFGNLSRFVESPRLTYWMQLESEAVEANIYCCESGLRDLDDLTLTILNKRKN